MQFWSLVLALAGLLLTLAGAIWLLTKITAGNPRYTNDGPLFPGEQTSQVLPRFIGDQARPALVVLAGSALQVAGGVLALLADLQ